jgi:TetR/AcrR family transcriptional repressor of bet genes
MGRPSNKLERRAEIVQAMMQVMAVCGYDGASIQAIAKQAGLAPGLIHYHFKTKQDILLESVAQLSNVLRDRYQSLSENAETAEDRLKAFISARLSKGEGASQQAVVAWVMIGSEAVRQPEVKAAYLEALREQKVLLEVLLQDYTVTFLKKCKLNKKELNSKIAFVMAFMEGAFSLSITAQEIMPDNWAAEELLTRLIG